MPYRAVPHRAAIYCRLSYAPDGSIEKVERQEDDCRALADRLGWKVVDKQLQDDAPPGVLRDNSRSAWQRNRKRPGWELLLGAVQRDEVDGVLVYHGDRLIRQPYDLELLLQMIEQRHLPLASVSGVRDLSVADDRFILRVEAAQACRQSDDTSRRVRRGWAARASKGLPVGGGRRPFGFSDTITIDPGESVILAEAAERMLAGQSAYGVVRWLNEVSTTTTGGRWSPKSLRNILAAPRIAGLVNHDGVLYEAVWEPIISVEDWHEIKAMYADSARAHPYPGRVRCYLLTGIAQCSACGNVMSTKPSGGKGRKKSRLYCCKQCRKISRNVEHLDSYVTARVLRRLQEPDLLDELTGESAKPGVGAEIAALQRRQEETRTQLEQLADHPELNANMIMRSLESFDRRVGELRARQATDARTRLLMRMAGIDRDRWDALPIDVRAEVVKALFRVVVLPATWRGPGFEAASVRLDNV